MTGNDDSRQPPPAGASVPMFDAGTGRFRGADRLSSPVAGLLFDMGDVLYDATVWRRWLLKLLRRLGLHVDYRSFYGVWDHDYLKDVHRGRRGLCEAFREFLLSFNLSLPQVTEVELACQARRRQLETGARPLPGVRATLARLQEAGLVLGVLSDSEYAGDVLEERLKRFGLGDMLTTVVSSFDLGHTKPEPICYLTALQAMALCPQQAAFVGHNTEELFGAKAVGMQTIAFNFGPDARADVYIARFEELLEVVDARAPYAAAG